MRIGWIRFNQAVELDFYSGVSSFLEDRCTLIRALLKEDAKVIVMTPVKGDLGRWFSNSRRLFLRPNEYCKCDVLVVEGGTTNMMYRNYTTKRPWIRDAMRIIDRHKGLVLWLQSDCLLPFPFFQLAHAEYPWDHHKNGYCGGPRGPGWTIVSGWGTHEELYDNKKHIVLMRSKKPKMFNRCMDGRRSRYRELGVRSIYFPIYVDFSLRKHLNVRKKTLKYGLVYCGCDRQRGKKIRQFYCDLPEDIKVDIFGKWHIRYDKGVTECKIEELPGPVFHPHILHPEADNIHNCCVCSLHVHPPVAAKLKWDADRPLEVIACRSIVLVDKELGDRQVDKKFLVADKEQLIEKFRWIDGLSRGERKVINEEQLHRIMKYSVANAARWIIDFVERRNHDI